MGGIYYNLWSCSNCDFQDHTVSGPFRVEAMPGVYKSIIEHRWCDDCQGIRRCFTGKPDIYKLYDLEYEPRKDIIFTWRRKNLDEIISRIDELENIKTKKSFFFLTKESKELKLLRVSIAKCDELTKKSTFFYNTMKPKPRCLICGGEKVNNVEWNLDRHSCGGVFKLTDSGWKGSVHSYTVIKYNEKGQPKHIVEKM